ncbi:nitronate monooxygenase [Terasakiella sp. A23]|uniref:NAD(P)H-dependent flavin oxidoreductase n=1 Tax=Terasakiella sp. FCG-A23 TaxID=3080561 RepID=UPI002954C14A|nr:nitronate monooxygenase [Terasakiella sp. A23]MDV7340718.1 nitronate monooxygenase [Terasakiella sp. A23]
MKSIKPVIISGREVHPIIEGGKGVAVSNGRSAGAFAAAGCVGTFSGVNADSYDDAGNPIPQVYKSKTRKERFEELIAYAIEGGIAQARIAHEGSNGQGRIHMNTLWEAGGTERIIHGVLEGAKGLIHGVTCGAGMPYKMAELASAYNVYYYPIVSSMRAFRALWKRSYSKHADLLGGVVYEDPWKAGGHNGLSNAERHDEPQDPYPRVAEIRKFMNSVGLNDVPVIMAGGVWYLRDWEQWLDNPEIGPVAFQYGSRPLLTQESPIPDTWKQRLLNLVEGDVTLNKYSPTGFYSSQLNNDFLKELGERAGRQVPFSRKATEELTGEVKVGARGRSIFVPADKQADVEGWIGAGYTEGMRTPDDTMIFVTPDRAQEILADQAGCMGCLSQCAFSNWADNEENTTGRLADPRSFCIQKTLQDIAHGGSVENNLAFAGHNAFKFAGDPLFQSGREGKFPTVAQLVEQILTGD